MNTLVQAVTHKGRTNRRGRGVGSLAVINETESEHSGKKSGSIKSSDLRSKISSQAQNFLPLNSKKKKKGGKPKIRLLRPQATLENHMSP